MYFYIDAAYHDGSDACDGDAIYDDDYGMYGLSLLAQAACVLHACAMRSFAITIVQSFSLFFSPFLAFYQLRGNSRVRNNFCPNMQSILKNLFNEEKTDCSAVTVGHSICILFLVILRLPGCGVEVGPNTAADHTAGVYVAEQDALFTQLDDGTKYQDYTYQVLAYYDTYNPSSSNGELVISYEGEVKQIVKIPQYHGVDYVNNPARSHYFFGCFRPYAGGYYLDTNGAGFYGKNDVDVPGPDDEYVIGDFGIFDDGLCNALRKWTGPAGYNHNDDQAGSDENVSG